MHVHISTTAKLAALSAITLACGESTLEALPESPVLADVQTLVFEPACATAGCHDASAAGDLDLSTEDRSRADLLDVTPLNGAARSSGWKRVVAGSRDDSFLYRKIVKPGLGEGAAMPIGVRLTEPYVGLIERWIDQGAL